MCVRDKEDQWALRRDAAPVAKSNNFFRIAVYQRRDVESVLAGDEACLSGEVKMKSWRSDSYSASENFSARRARRYEILVCFRVPIIVHLLLSTYIPFKRVGPIDPKKIHGKVT